MSGSSKTPADLFQFLDDLGISTSTVTHPPLFTVADSKALRGELPGGHCKNLFLRNKKGQMWLVVCHEDQQIDLNQLGERLGAGRVSFASPDRLQSHLGVLPGAVTPFAVINDDGGAVQVAIDGQLLSESLLNFHPLVNDQTTTITPADLMRFLVATAHDPVMTTFAQDGVIRP